MAKASPEHYPYVMNPAPSAGSEGIKKKRRRKRPAHRAPQNHTSGEVDTTTPAKKGKPAPPKPPYAKRVDEISAGGLVIDETKTQGLLIGRRDHKDATGKRIHKTVHHFQFKKTGGILAPQESEVDEVGWFPLNEIIGLLAYPDEKKLIARTKATEVSGTSE